jgi:hypothetical protein
MYQAMARRERRGGSERLPGATRVRADPAGVGGMTDTIWRWLRRGVHGARIGVLGPAYLRARRAERATGVTRLEPNGVESPRACRAFDR